LGSAVMFLSPSTSGTDELKTAWATTGLHLMRLYHDFVWLKHYSLFPKEQSEEKDSPPARPLVNFPVKSISLSALLSVVENVSLLFELLCEFSIPSEDKDKIKFRVIVIIELVKALLRLQLLRVNDGAMLVHRAIPPRDVLHNDQPQPLKTPSGDEDSFEEALGKTRPPRKRPSLMDIIRNGIPDSEVTVPQNSKPTLSIIVGELLWIVRPLIYLLVASSRGEKSWWPFVIALCFDLWSRRLHQPSRVLTKTETEELSKRARQAAIFYLFRTPIADKVFGRLPDEPTSSPRSFIGFISGIITELIRLYRTRYFYTASST